MDDLIKDKIAVKKVLEDGKTTEFWKIIVQALEESKQAIQRKQDAEEMMDLPAEQYKVQNEVFKSKKEFIDKLIKTPDNIMSWLEEPNNEEKEFDPY